MDVTGGEMVGAGLDRLTRECHDRHAAVEGELQRMAESRGHRGLDR